MLNRLTFIALSSAALLSGCVREEPIDQASESALAINTPPASSYAERLEASDKDPDNWLLHGRTYRDLRYSPLGDIDTENVNQLGLDWFIDLPRDGGQEATPIVADGVMYVSAAWSVVRAIDAATGRVLWTYDPKVPRQTQARACCGPVNRGVAVWEDKVFVGTLDGRLVAIEAATGGLLWSVQTTDPASHQTITGAPRVARGKVFIGNGGAEFGVRGYVTAYDAGTGRQLWRFYTVPGDPSLPVENEIHTMTKTTWHGEWWKVGGGGTVWDSMSYDPDLNLLYIGVGNSGPYVPTLRSAGRGDNLFVSSIVAVDADTGKYVWHYQTTPGDAFDFTATQNMILTELVVDGETRKVLMQQPKNGFFYVLDRETGEFINAKPVDKVTWTDGVDETTGRADISESAKYWLQEEPTPIWPSSRGTHNWQPMAMHEKTGFVYIPVSSFPGVRKVVDDFEFRPQGRNTGVSYSFDLPVDPDAMDAVKRTAKTFLLAWDPSTQTEVWRAEHEPGASGGGVLATGENLVFQGDEHGELSARDATTGEMLWRFDTQTSVIAAPMSYRVGGEQYIAVLVGRGGSSGRSFGPILGQEIVNRSRLLAFKLGGSVALPAPEDTELQLPDYSAIDVDTQRVARGMETYGHFCSSCHGLGAVAGSVVPDLRFSGYLGSEDAFSHVVMDGPLADRGMVGFTDVLERSDTEDIRHYVIHQNQEARRYGLITRIGR